MILLVLILQFIETFSIAPRAVEVNLETSFIIRPRDFYSQYSTINRIKQLLVGLDTHFRAGDAEFRSRSSGQLTKFLHHVGAKLIKQDHEYLKKLSVALKATIHDYYYRPNIQYFIKDKALNSFIIDTLDGWENLSVKDIKSIIKMALENDDTIFNKAVNFFDRFYNETDTKPLRDIAAQITGDIENSNTDVDKIVKDSLNIVIIRKLRSLSYNDKNILIGELLKIINGDNVVGVDRELDNGTEMQALSESTEDEDVETPPKIQIETKHKLSKSTKGISQMKDTKIVSDLNYRAENEATINRAEDKTKIARTNENLPKEFLLTIDSKDGGLQIFIPNKHVQDELGTEIKLQIEEKPLRVHEKLLGHKRAEEEIKNNDRIRGVEESRSRESTGSDMGSLELIQQEGDILLKQVEEEVHKVSNSQN